MQCKLQSSGLVSNVIRQGLSCMVILMSLLGSFQIFELRFEGVEGSLRVLYFFFDGDKAVLTNGFPKQSNKTPKNEKQTAVGRRENYFQKHKDIL